MRDFYAECWRMAWRGKLFHVEAISGMLALLAVPVVAFWDPGDTYINWIPLTIFAAVFVTALCVGLITAPYWIAKELEEQTNRLKSEIAVLRNKEIELVYIPHDKRHFFAYDGAQVASIRVQNSSTNCFKDLDIFCESAIPIVSGDDPLLLHRNTSLVKTDLSPGEHRYVNIVTMSEHFYETHYESLLPFRGPVDCMLKGAEFSLKIVALASNVPNPTRMRLNFGKRDGAVYAEVPGE